MNEAVITPTDFTEVEIQTMLDNLDQYTDDEVVEIHKIVAEIDSRNSKQVIYDDLIEFCKHMQPDYKVGKT